MKTSEIQETLSPFLPDHTAEWVANFLREHRVVLKIKKPRSSKLGDYRSPFKDKGHRISINNDLNPYSFFITLTHEFAHLLTWNDYKNSVKPHGEEWKYHFKNLIIPFIKNGVFPKELDLALLQYITNPSATSCTDVHLVRALAKFDEEKGQFLSELEQEDIFQLPNGLVLVKGQKLRKYYKCKTYNGSKLYRVNEMAKVKKIKL